MFHTVEPQSWPAGSQRKQETPISMTKTIAIATLANTLSIQVPSRRLVWIVLKPRMFEIGDYFSFTTHPSCPSNNIFYLPRETATRQWVCSFACPKLLLKPDLQTSGKAEYDTSPTGTCSEFSVCGLDHIQIKWPLVGAVRSLITQSGVNPTWNQPCCFESSVGCKTLPTC